MESKSQYLKSQTPREISGELDKYIIGQDAAKKAVAIALRNRWRRLQVRRRLRSPPKCQRPGPRR